MPLTGTGKDELDWRHYVGRLFFQPTVVGPADDDDCDIVITDKFRMVLVQFSYFLPSSHHEKSL